MGEMMQKNISDITICGAGIAGVSTAYSLAQQGIRNITLIDELPPINLTSSRSTECYRNWWPDPEVLQLMNHSIDLLEALADKTGNKFSLNRRGYLFVTADESRIKAMELRARKISSLGAGPLRIHADLTSSSYKAHSPEGYADHQNGADLLIGSSLLNKYFPHLSEDSVAALHVRRAGWMSAQQMGMLMFEEARAQGVNFRTGKVTHVEINNNTIRSIEIDSSERISTGIFINAAGPFFKNIGALCQFDIPVTTELHLKVALKDKLKAVPRDAPLLIWDDPQFLDWSEEESISLASDPETRWLTESFPSGAHTRPEGGPDSDSVILLWEYQSQEMAPTINPPLDDFYPEVALRGMARMIPAFRGYFGRMPRPNLDGGFYTKSRDNRPIVGPTPINGIYLIGALSGYGIMSSCGVGDLLSHYISGSALPPYAKAFSLERFTDPAYLAWMETLSDSGQL